MIDPDGRSKARLRVLLFSSSAPAQPPNNLVWIQEGNNVSLSWDPVKAKENESDVIGYMVMTCFKNHVRVFLIGPVSLFFLSQNPAEQPCIHNYTRKFNILSPLYSLHEKGFLYQCP